MTAKKRGWFGKLARHAVVDRDAELLHYVETKRSEIVFALFEFDGLVDAGRVARAIWAYAEQVDLSDCTGRSRRGRTRPTGGRSADDAAAACLRRGCGQRAPAQILLFRCLNEKFKKMTKLKWLCC